MLVCLLSLALAPIEASQVPECLNCLVRVQILPIESLQVLVEAPSCLVLFTPLHVQFSQFVECNGFLIFYLLSSLSAFDGFFRFIELLIAVGQRSPHTRVLRSNELVSDDGKLLTLRGQLERSSVKRNRRSD